MTQVNRTLPDKAMDNIDHALGRPLDPVKSTYRNRYITGDKTRFAENPHWRNVGRIGDLFNFRVTDQGRAALKTYLAEIGDPHKRYDVWFDKYRSDDAADFVFMGSVIATTRAKARYKKWRDLYGPMDCTFTDFMKHSRIRLARS